MSHCLTIPHFIKVKAVCYPSVGRVVPRFLILCSFQMQWLCRKFITKQTWYSYFTHFIFMLAASTGKTKHRYQLFMLSVCVSVHLYLRTSWRYINLVLLLLLLLCGKQWHILLYCRQTSC